MVGLAVLVFFPGFIKGLGKAVSVVEHLSLLARHGGLTHRSDRSGELSTSPGNSMSRTLARAMNALAVLDCEGKICDPWTTCSVPSLLFSLLSSVQSRRELLGQNAYFSSWIRIDDVMGLSVLDWREPTLRCLDDSRPNAARWLISMR